jgi:hypothetical protein
LDVNQYSLAAAFRTIEQANADTSAAEDVAPG